MKGTKSIKLLILSVVLTLAFLVSFNLVYGYFTTKKETSGNVNMGNLNVRFAYNSNGTYTLVEQDSYEIQPSKDGLFRGESFQMKTDSGDVINTLYFFVSSDSCDCYIRFFINAYAIINGEPDKSVNYGQYFEFVTDTYTRQIKTNGDESNAVYYSNSSLNYGYKTIGNTIKILDDAPNELLNSVVQVVITFDAVQAANNAFASVFSDGWGYLDTWE